MIWSGFQSGPGFEISRSCLSALGLHKLGSGRVAERKRKFKGGGNIQLVAQKMAIFFFSFFLPYLCMCLCVRVFPFFG